MHSILSALALGLAIPARRELSFFPLEWPKFQRCSMPGGEAGLNSQLMGKSPSLMQARRPRSSPELKRLRKADQGFREALGLPLAVIGLEAPPNPAERTWVAHCPERNSRHLNSQRKPSLSYLQEREPRTAPSAENDPGPWPSLRRCKRTPL
jgi:hypothetical protein